jgi:RNA polymerase sigma-70 factor, ECF subfamily
MAALMAASVKPESVAKPPADQPTDEELIEQYRRGRAAAFEQLIERYRQELFNFLARFLGDRIAAEDVFQETFLQVHMSAGTFDTERRFKPWLFTIAANKGRDHLRRRARRPAAEINAPIGHEDEPGQTFIDLMEADLPGPEDHLDRVELGERVRAAVAEMPPHLREILLLAYFQQLSYNEIAEALMIPLGTVKSRLHTAVGAFAKMWKDKNPAGGSA